MDRSKIEELRAETERLKKLNRILAPIAWISLLVYPVFAYFSFYHGAYLPGVGFLGLGGTLFYWRWV